MIHEGMLKDKLYTRFARSVIDNALCPTMLCNYFIELIQLHFAHRSTCLDPSVRSCSSSRVPHRQMLKELTLMFGIVVM